VIICAALYTAVQFQLAITYSLIIGLFIFGFIFAINSSIHSYLILAYTKTEEVALNVGFYYMANACGRLTGTLLSGLAYLYAGLPACLITATVLTLIAMIIHNFVFLLFLYLFFILLEMTSSSQPLLNIRKWNRKS